MSCCLNSTLVFLLIRLHLVFGVAVANICVLYSHRMDYIGHASLVVGTEGSKCVSSMYVFRPIVSLCCCELYQSALVMLLVLWM
jgi:hypothetical protein